MSFVFAYNWKGTLHLAQEANKVQKTQNDFFVPCSLQCKVVPEIYSVSPCGTGSGIARRRLEPSPSNEGLSSPQPSLAAPPAISSEKLSQSILNQEMNNPECRKANTGILVGFGVFAGAIVFLRYAGDLLVPNF
ncbi:hypothetical protein O181_048899 [Austropuccinia psidii MF-1]|uniref:Uncharacterized protein n=1 Tax=Austropuccinia psidii MF-1 TaxID=1389203 RepID=A0A9Q3HNB4_9BASI|nr:hypothetical protein [Austropuccinia psidii MF-1]